MLYFIGGAPTTGKSTLAKRIAHHLNSQYISTDHVWRVVRSFVDRDKYPDLLLNEKRLTLVESPYPSVEHEYAPAKLVIEGINAITFSEPSTTGSLVIEGISIMPHLIYEYYGSPIGYRALFLIDEDGDRIRNVIEARVQRNDTNIPSETKEKIVRSVQVFSRKIKQEALNSGYPYLEVTKTEADLKATLALLEIEE